MASNSVLEILAVTILAILSGLVCAMVVGLCIKSARPRETDETDAGTSTMLTISPVLIASVAAGFLAIPLLFVVRGHSMSYISSVAAALAAVTVLIVALTQLRTPQAASRPSSVLPGIAGGLFTFSTALDTLLAGAGISRNTPFVIEGAIVCLVIVAVLSQLLARLHRTALAVAGLVVAPLTLISAVLNLVHVHFWVPSWARLFVGAIALLVTQLIAPNRRTPA